MSNLALCVSEVTKSYTQDPVLGPVSLNVPEGQFVSLVGSNGSGKTTLLRLISGLLDITSGEVAIYDFVAGSLDARAEVSYIPDDPVLYDDLSVSEHIEYLAPLYGAEDWQESSQVLLDAFSLTDRRDDLPATFSRGLRQKTSLILGLIRPYRLLLIDEPFVGLDEKGRVALLDQLEQAKARGATIILASHQLDLVRKADRLVALAEGQVTFDGNPGDADLNKMLG